jgi:CBS domain-containing protein
MRVRDVMTRGVECIPPNASIASAADRMRQLNVGVLPVCEHGRPIGVVTDRDITVRATAGCRGPTTPVRDCMTPGVISCFEDQGVVEAAGLMEDNQVRRLVVYDRDHRLVGIVSLGDLAVKGINEHLSSEALERVSQPAAPAR